MSPRAAPPSFLAATAALAAALPVASARAGDAVAPTALEAFGRSVDLAAYLKLLPPESFFVDQPSGRIYFAATDGDTRRLSVVPLPRADGAAEADFDAATALSQIDMAGRNFWGAAFSTALDRTLILTDEAGEERTNLYVVGNDGAFERLTDVGYVYGWSFSPDGRRLAYSGREAGEFTPGSIRVVDLPARHEQVLYRDSPALRPYWSRPAWRPDGRSFLVTMLLDENRRRQNIALVDALGQTDGPPRLVTDRGVEREVILPESPWVDADRFIYVSTESGRHELYLGSLAGGARLIVPRRNDQPATLPDAIHIADVGLITDSAGPAALVIAKGPQRDLLRVMALPSGRIVYEHETSDDLSLASTLGGVAILRASSPEQPARLLSLAARNGAYDLRTAASYGDDVTRLVHCQAQKISFRTFDGLSAPGESGTLHAWLYRPRNPLPAGKSTVVIEAFYGGGRSFHSIYPLPVPQLFCAAGVHFLSPAPRGSWNMGAEFHDLIRGNLGGAEILDVGAAARWVQAELGIPPARTGLYGLSHGGYAVMRLLTLPTAVDGTPVDFRVGFGISDAGISNLLRHARESNVRGWLTELTGGPPEDDPDKWLDRSPETHANRIQAPLLLLHGTHDIRVRPVESRAMAERPRADGKPVTLVELEGAAHNSAPLPALQRYWRSIFEFLESVVE